MVNERWLLKEDERIRGKPVCFRIAPEGKIAYKYAIKLEDSTKINQAFQLLLISTSMEMNYLEKVIDGHETTSIFDYDPKKATSEYYSLYTNEGVTAEDLLEKQGRPPNGIFAHLNFQESEERDLFSFFTEKNLFEKRIITTKGERKYRYFLVDAEFKDCIISCITMLHSEVESRMFFVWKTVRKPKG